MIKGVFDNPILQNGRKNKEFSHGELLKATNGAIIPIKFNYSMRHARTFGISTSLMPGHENTTATETIFTSRLDLAFSGGDKVTLQDGRTMKVTGATYEYDTNAAYMTGDGRKGWLITLEGGYKR